MHNLFQLIVGMVEEATAVEEEDMEGEVDMEREEVGLMEGMEEEEGMIVAHAVGMGVGSITMGVEEEAVGDIIKASLEAGEEVVEDVSPLLPTVAHLLTAFDIPSITCPLKPTELFELSIDCLQSCPSQHLCLKFLAGRGLSYELGIQLIDVQMS